MRTAVVYYSLQGNTEMVAKEIANSTGADLIKLEPVEEYPDKGFKKFFWGGKSAVMGDEPKLKPYVFNLDAYDNIILGFPIWAGTFVPPIRSFIKANPGIITKKISVFACQSGRGAEGAFKKLKKEFDIAPIENELILIDPKDKPSNENEDKIKAFCSKFC